MRKLDAQPEIMYDTNQKGFILGQAFNVKDSWGRSWINPPDSVDKNCKLVISSKWISTDGRAIPPMDIYKWDQQTMGWYAVKQHKE